MYTSSSRFRNRETLESRKVRSHSGLRTSWWRRQTGIALSLPFTAVSMWHIEGNEKYKVPNSPL